jgi:farnesyl diphosphate synthase
MSGTDAKKAARAKFEAAWARIRSELLANFASESMPDDAQAWFKRNLDYNTPGGKLNRGLSVVDTVQIIKGRPLNDEEYFKAAVLGWGVELVRKRLWDHLPTLIWFLFPKK